MNRISSKFPILAARAGVTAALFASVAFASAVHAASIGPLQMAASDAPRTDAVSTQVSPTQMPASAKQVATTMGAAKASPADRVETRIKGLHDKLKITRTQEDLWSRVAEAMRANAKEMEPLIKARDEQSKTATAIEDLNSYSQLAEAHADGLKKFLPVFAPLYDSMSDIQKRNADTVFRSHSR